MFHWDENFALQLHRGTRSTNFKNFRENNSLDIWRFSSLNKIETQDNEYNKEKVTELQFQSNEDNYNSYLPN